MPCLLLGPIGGCEEARRTEQKQQHQVGMGSGVETSRSVPQSALGLAAEYCSATAFRQ